MKLRLGVLITYFNEGELLRVCLESLVNQSESPDEILVYDDASMIPPDDFIDPKWNVRVIRGKTNRGPSYGRNQLLAASTTDIIHFHDCDDRFRGDWCAKVRAAFAEPDVTFVVHELRSEAGKTFAENILQLRDLPKFGNDLLRFAIRNAILPSAACFRRELALEVGGYDETTWSSEDHHFHALLASRSPHFRAIEEPLVTKVIRGESRSEQREEVWMGAAYSVLLLSEVVPLAYYPDLAEKAADAGAKLHEIGSGERAAEVFLLAKYLGGAKLSNRPRIFRLLSSVIGQSRVEWIATYYRKWLPTRLRKLFR